MALVAPVQVSPLIKFCRWSFLLAGIVYGSTRYAALSNKEKARLAEKERLRPVREAKAAEERNRLQAEELKNLSEAAGVEFK